MENLTMNREDKRDRGQLIIAAGLVIAIVLIGLTIILNGVLYVENYSAQPQPHGVDRGHESLLTVHDLVRTTIEEENDKLYTTDGVAVTNTSRAVSTFSDQYQYRMYKLHGVVATTHIVDTRKAWVVTQNESAEYRASEHALTTNLTSDWKMGTFTGVRNGEMTVMSASEWQNDADDDLFRIHVSGSDDDWDMWVFNHPSSDRIAIGTEVDPATGSPEVACSAPADADGANITFEPLSIDGERCGNVSFGDGVGDGPYDVYVLNGENATGTYTFAFGRGDSASLADGILDPYVRNTLDGDSPSGTDPTAYDGVYSITTHVELTGPSFNMSSKRTIAPNEPESTEPDRVIP